MGTRLWEINYLYLLQRFKITTLWLNWPVWYSWIEKLFPNLVRVMLFPLKIFTQFNKDNITNQFLKHISQEQILDAPETKRRCLKCPRNLQGGVSCLSSVALLISFTRRTRAVITVVSISGNHISKIPRRRETQNMINKQKISDFMVYEIVIFFPVPREKS